MQNMYEKYIDNKDLYDNKSKDYDELSLSEIYNEYTLNLFSDASITKRFGAYGSIAVCRDYELERSIFTKENTTVNECELSGIRLSLLMAYKYQFQFTTINIFTDSKLSVDIINSFKRHNYRQCGIDIDGNPKYEITRYVKSNNKDIAYANQQLIADCVYIYSELLKNPNIVVHLLHQPAHLIPNSFDNMNNIKNNNLLEAKQKFIDINPIYSCRTPSTEFMIYISKYNDAMDRSTRIVLHEMGIRENQMYFTTPLHFKPLCCNNPSLLERRYK